MGTRLYFPKGIVYQAELAKDARIKATAGVAYQNSELAYLPEIQDQLSHTFSHDIMNYAPVTGIPKLREVWKQSLKQKNPSLNFDFISTPIVTSGLTHAISCVLHLFIDAQDTLIIPNYFWENYAHIANTVLQAQCETFPMFTSDTPIQFNLDGLETILRSHLEQNKPAKLLFNFPNNPTGYSLSTKEAQDLFDLLYKYAELGLPLLTISDDAYFGLWYEDTIYQESLFSQLSQLHDNILAVKIDGATKEMLAWGARVGFITLGNKNLSNDVIQTLEEKIKAFTRSTITSASRVSQTIILNALQSPSLTDSIIAHKNDIKTRFLAASQCVAQHQQQYPNSNISPLPCNSGYFMLFNCPSEKFAESLRTIILEKEQIALISMQNNIRFTFSCVDTQNIPPIIQAIYTYAETLSP